MDDPLQMGFNLNTVFPHIVFRRNYSFFDLEIQRSQYIKPKFTVQQCAETIQGRKLFKGRNYMRKYGNCVPLSRLYCS